MEKTVGLRTHGVQSQEGATARQLANLFLHSLIMGIFEQIAAEVAAQFQGRKVLMC